MFNLISGAQPTTIQAYILLASLLSYFIFIIWNSGQIWEQIKKVPYWLVTFNCGFLLYRLFFVPHIISSRSDFGAWMLGMAKGPSLGNALLDRLTPVYFFIIKLLSYIFGGIDFNFVSCFHVILSFISVFCVYIFVIIIFKDKIIAGISALLYAISPIIYLFSFTEDYTNPSIFFSIQALLFAAFFIKNTRISFLLLAVASSFLAIGSRPEYIIFALPFVIFLYFFSGKIKKIYLIVYSLLLIPRFLIAADIFFNSTDHTGLHGRASRVEYFTYDLIYNHAYLFFNNLNKNISAILGLKTLMGIFVFFALFIMLPKIIKPRNLLKFNIFRSFNLKISGYFNKKSHKMAIEYNKNKKLIIFFLFYYLIFFLYYTFMHNEGLGGSYKYIASLVFPLVILAAAGLRQLYFFYPKFIPLLLVAVSCYSLYSTSFFINRGEAGYFFPFTEIDGDAHYYEYFTYQSHKNEIDLSINSRFISSGCRTHLFSALPVREEIIFCIASEDDLKSVINDQINPGNIIYITHGLYGGLNEQYKETIKSVEFMKLIKKYFTIEKMILNIYINDELGFLYQVSLKNHTHN